MKIGILSDSHGSASAWEKAVNLCFKGCDLIIHAGDVLYHGPRNPLPEGHNPQKLVELINSCPVPVVFARGNCDAEIDGVLIKFPIQAPYAYLNIDNRSVLVTHGQDLDTGKMDELAALYRADVYISGHTHIPVLEKRGRTLFLNPGSCALPKGEEGPTVAIWEGDLFAITGLPEGNIISSIKL